MFSCLQILEAFLWFVLITLLNVTLIILTLSCLAHHRHETHAPNCMFSAAAAPMLSISQPPSGGGRRYKISPVRVQITAVGKMTRAPSMCSVPGTSVQTSDGTKNPP